MLKKNLYFEKKENYCSLERLCILTLSHIKKIDKIKNNKSLTVNFESNKAFIEETGIYIKNEFKKTYRMVLPLSIKDDFFIDNDNLINVYINIKEQDLAPKEIETIKTQILEQQLNVSSESPIDAVLEVYNFFVKKRKVKSFGLKFDIEKNENIIKKNKHYKKAMKAKSYMELIPSIQSKTQIEFKFLNSKIEKEITVQSKYPKSKAHYNMGISFPLGVNPFVDNFKNKTFLINVYNKILLKEVGLELNEDDFKNFDDCSRKIKQITEIQKY